jgi:chemotaxis protein CheX
MRAEYANPFISAAVTTFKKELRVALSRNSLGVKESPVPSKDVAIIIGVTGMVKGQVVYSMDSDFAYAVAKSMLPDKLPADLKKLTNSAVSEIANIITGQASIILAGEKQKIEITPPAVFCGGATTMDFLSLQTICLSFLSEIGSFEINIALTEDRS